MMAQTREDIYTQEMHIWKQSAPEHLASGGGEGAMAKCYQPN